MNEICTPRNLFRMVRATKNTKIQVRFKNWKQESKHFNLVCVVRLLGNISSVVVGYCKTRITVPHSIWHFHFKNGDTVLQFAGELVV